MFVYIIFQCAYTVMLMINYTGLLKRKHTAEWSGHLSLYAVVLCESLELVLPAFMQFADTKMKMQVMT